MSDLPRLELWLVRHGETPRSRDGRTAGWVDTPLTRRGVAEAQALRPVLAGRRYDGVWASDLRRALRTAREAWGEPRRDRRLRELCFGELEGRRWECLPPAVKTALLNFEGFAPPGGETLVQLRHRVLAFLGSLPAGRHLLFTHGGVVRTLTHEAGLDEFLPTGSLIVLDWDARRVLLTRRGTAR